MPVVNGIWLPDTFEKQDELMRLCREKNGLRKYIMVCGPRWTGKTIGCLNAVVDHAWNTARAAVSVLCTTITAGADQGVWTLLTESILPQWIEGDFGLEWATNAHGKDIGSPRQHGVTKKFYCIIKNKHGGTSRIQLDSLKDEREVEKDFKNRYLTAIYWSEVSNFVDPNTYFTLIQALRGVGVPQDEFLLLGDTNPAANGTDSWIYKEWYEFRLADPSTLTDDERPRQKYLKLLTWAPDDNPHLSEEFKAQKRAEFAADPDLFARYWLGQWKKATTGALFIGQFKRSIHVIEDIADEETHEVYIGAPEPETDEIDLGWDIGESNHAVEFAVPMLREDGLLVFRYFDEVVFIGGVISVGDVVAVVPAKMRKWESFLGRMVRWTHWSDRSSLDQRQSISNRLPAEEVFNESDSEISLIGVDNTRGSLRPSVRHYRRMLFQQRLEFCEANCPKLIEMNTALMAKPFPRGVELPPGWLPDTVAERSPHKHPFDAARYILMGRCWEEIIASILTKTRAKAPPQKLISVPL